MAHYDFLYEEQTRDDILKEIERQENIILRLTTEINNIKNDLNFNLSEVSNELLNEELNKNTRDIIGTNKKHQKLLKLLSQHDNGKRFTY